MSLDISNSAIFKIIGPVNCMSRQFHYCHKNMDSNILVHLGGVSIYLFTCLLYALQIYLCHNCWHDFIIKKPFAVFHMGPMNLCSSKWSIFLAPTISVYLCWFLWCCGGGISWRWYQEISAFRCGLAASLLESDNILAISDIRMLTSSSKD